MSDAATEILMEQVSDEILKMSVSDFFALLDEYGFDGSYDRMCDILSDVVDAIVEDRSL